MSLLRRGGLLLSAAVLLTFTRPVLANPPVQKDARPNVEVVFCLDTTGSMGGLIAAAKQKIWSICNQIAGGKPTPNLKVGLVAYRDRGPKEEYVTRVYDLTDDLDAVHGHLMGFKAAGGGDIPESVNQALHEAVTKITWSTDKKTLRIIFLVGDAPPHMDYPDDVKYPVTCELACKKAIIINTIQCGNDPDCEKYWKDICKKAEGRYVRIDQNGGPIVAVATPYDADLVKINTELAKTTVVFGDAKKQKLAEAKKESAAKLPVPAAADRAACVSKGGITASYDLLDNVKAKKVKLEDLKDEQLPPELKKLTLKERREYLDKLDKRRGELNKEAVELDKKRTDFINKKLAEDKKGKAGDSFDNQVLLILQHQAARSNIQYGTPPEKKK
jgi:Mg-chelatase subunit ChlD